MDTINDLPNGLLTPDVATAGCQARPRWQRSPILGGLPPWLQAIPFLLMHVACLTVFLVGVNWAALGMCAASYAVRMFGITAGYHRYFSHRAFKTSRVFQFMLAFVGSSSLQKGPLWWAAHHRRHHRDADQPGDPHSPHRSGFWWSHVGWFLASIHDETDWNGIRDFSRYPELRWLNRYHWVPGLILAGFCYWLDGWRGVVWGFVISTVLLWHAVFSINSLAHLFGGRRYVTSDESRNNWVLALLTFGEGWHNNHHYYPSSANQGFFWWELDVTDYFIRLMNVFGLVRDVRRVPQDKLAANLPAQRTGIAK